MPARVAALLLGAGIVGVSAWAALAGTLWGFGLKCDDSCGSPPPWREDPGAWQWSALGWSSLLALGLALAALAAIVRRRTWLAAVALAAWALVGAAFLVLLDESGLA